MGTIVTLPSGQTSIEISPVDGKAERMFEDKKLARNGALIDKYLVDRIVSVNGDSSLTPQWKESFVLGMFSGDRNYLLYQIRIDSYGPELTFNHECPKCNKTSGYKIDLNEIVADGTIKIHPYREPLRVELPRSGGYAVIRHMTGRDEKNLTQLANSNNRALNAATLLRIAELNGKEPSPQEWLELIGEDRAIIRGAIEAMNKAGLDMELELTCLECGSDYKIALSAVPDFFVPSKTNTERYME